MAVQGGPNWSTKDYFDPWPGIQMGMARRQQAEQSDRNKVNDARTAENDRMRQAEVLSQMGVDPIPGPSGGIDWSATVKAARMKQELGKQAQALATFHAWSGGPTSLTQEEDALRQTPEYQQTYRAVSAVKAQEDARQLAIQEQIAARGREALKVAEQRGTNASKPSATITRKLPDGSTVRIPVSPEDALKMGQPGDGQPAKGDKWQEAIEKVKRFKAAGQAIDVEIDDNGFPKISKSHVPFTHDASPSDAGSYDRIIEQIMERGGSKDAPAPKSDMGGKRPMITIPR